MASYRSGDVNDNVKKLHYQRLTACDDDDDDDVLLED